jgi:hypothetical protein
MRFFDGVVFASFFAADPGPYGACSSVDNTML